MHAVEGGVEVGLVEVTICEEGLGIPGEVVGLGSEEGDGRTSGSERAGEGEDVAGGAAAAVEEDDGAGGLIESGAGAVKVLRGRRGLGWLGTFVRVGRFRRGFVEGDGGKGYLSSSERRDSNQGGRQRRSPRDSRGSSMAKPGLSVASSNRTPPGSRK